MGKMIDAGTAAALLKVNVQRMRLLCRQRRVPGARLVGRVWMIPEDFKVIPGSRGKTLTADERILRKIRRVMKQADALARRAGEVEKKSAERKRREAE